MLALHRDSTMSARCRRAKQSCHTSCYEHLAGYFIVQVASLDEALESAARAPCASDGSVEVRPLLPPPPTQ